MAKKSWETPVMHTLGFGSDAYAQSNRKLCRFPFPQSINNCQPITLIRVPLACNKSWPQAQVCRSRRVPQRTIRCTHKAKTLS